MTQVTNPGFAQRLKLAMNMVGLSSDRVTDQARLLPGRLLGLTSASETPTAGELARLADVLGVPEGWLGFGKLATGVSAIVLGVRFRLEKSKLDECDKQWVLQLLEMLPEA
jgi:hypothetical protein